MRPISEQLELPASYGSPHRLLDWESVEQRLVDSPHYWLATVRGNGTPHVVPLDGLWLDGSCYFDGDPATVHVRNLRRNGRAALHLENADSVVIVEGIAEWTTPSTSVAKRLVAVAKAKYGYAQSTNAYLVKCGGCSPSKSWRGPSCTLTPLASFLTRRSRTPEGKLLAITTSFTG